MKLHLPQFKIFLYVFIIGLNINTQSAHSSSRINRIEVSTSSVCIGLLFDFTKKTLVKPSFNEATQTLSLFFPEVKIREFEKSEGWAAFNTLAEHGLSIELENQPEKSSGSFLKISFTKIAPSKELIVKWSSIGGPGSPNAVKTGSHRFTVDIFNAHAIRMLKRQPLVQLATNDVIQNDFSPTPGLLSHQKKTNQSRRIVIDAGHGGSDHGAIGCHSLKEKDITLKIAHHLKKKLTAAGYRVHLSRSEDTTTPIPKRASLANQLKADAFISLHLNSAGKRNPKARGLETYYLSSEGILEPSHVGGYYFVNSESSPALIKKIDQFFKLKIDKSKNLASSIHTQVVDTLKKRKFKIKDRGIKEEHFRLFYHNSIPTTLVEVGFITNADEAKLLQSDSYQEVIARGILQGINNYFTAE